MRLGIGFSCCNQASQVSVNGKLITENAGNNDDSADSSFSDGNLITVGDDNDPFSPYMPTYQQDHERYNLVPYVATGDRSIKIDTLNPSGDDNIFLAVFHVYGRAGVNTQPPTTTVPSKGADSAAGWRKCCVATQTPLCRKEINPAFGQKRSARCAIFSGDLLRIEIKPFCKKNHKKP